MVWWRPHGPVEAPGGVQGQPQCGPLKLQGLLHSMLKKDPISCHLQGDVVAQWVERRPRDPMDSMTRGSNPVRSTRKICERGGKEGGNTIVTLLGLG